MTLKEKMKRGPVFGMACFTGTTCVIENIAMSGLDFIYLDLEHTNYMLDEAFEKQIMAAKLHDIAVLVRMADENEVAIRKVLEWGADGVVIPHCKTTEKFLPGRIVFYFLYGTYFTGLSRTAARRPPLQPPPR